MRSLPVLLSLAILASSVALSTSAASTVGPGETRIRIHVDAPGSAADATFGTSSAASSDYDEGIDRPSPPPPPGGAWSVAYFDGPDSPSFASKLDCDIVGEAETSEWTLHILVSSEGGMVRISFSTSDIEAVTRAYLVQLVDESHVYDLREEGTFDRIVTADSSGQGVDTILTLRIIKDPGPPPSPPRGVIALPGASVGDNEVRWRPPASSGGAPVFAYAVYRSWDGVEFREVGRTAALRFIDHGQAIGRPLRYVVTAISDIGESLPSNTSMTLGADAFAPLPEEHEGWQSHEIASADVEKSKLPDVPTGIARVWITEEEGHDVIHLGAAGVELRVLGRDLSRLDTPVSGAPLVDSARSANDTRGAAPDMRVVVWTRSDPQSATCAGAACAMTPPGDASTWSGDAWEAGLFVTIEIEGQPSVSLWFPLAGQAVANGVRLVPE